MTAHAVTLAMIQEAGQVLAGFARHTDLLAASTSVFGPERRVLIKAENLQRTGSFKVRGAFNRMRLLTEAEAKAGVICASAGNHAQGVALAAARLGIKAYIVMPRSAPISKIEATRAYGAEVVLAGDSYDAAMTHAMALQRERSLSMIHPFDDPYVIAGQGTIGLEILRDCPEVKTVAIPIGGGGLAAGVALAVKESRPDVRVIGVEPENAASMAASWLAGTPARLEQCSTIADGVAVACPGSLTYDLCRRYLDAVVTVSENEIATTILTMLERSKMVMEGAGAVALAALLYRPELTGAGSDPSVAVVSGGNIDVNMIERIISRGLMNSGRLLRLRVTVPDRPGHLSRLLDLLASHGVNILSVVHDRLAGGLAIGQVAVALEMETANRRHAGEVEAALRESGYQIAGEG